MTITVQFRDSWSDTVAQATREHGEAGRVVALLRQGQNKGSKRLIASCIEQAGYNVAALLAFFGQPYSSIGLQTVCQLQADAIEKGEVIIE